MAAMANAESPRTVFEVVYTMFEEAPGDMVYDNMCTLHHYALNREPEFFKLTGARVDAMHYRDHTRCAPDFNSALYHRVTNSQVAEQKNAVLQKMGSALSYMHQHTFLFFVRHWLHRMHRIEQQKRDGQCFWA
jgi:formylmethanofuran dehydrogenase subunit E-like metal-binding protein